MGAPVDQTERARRELVRAVEELGYGAELGVIMAGELKGKGSMLQMAAYLRQARPRSLEEIVDEMLAIVQMRETRARKRQAEESNARYWQMYGSHFGLDD